jgi:group I intron endonuclease
MYSNKDNPSCIYKITNIINNNLYVGSCYKVKQRRSKHFKDLDNNKHGNRHLQNAYNKYGKENFRFEVIEELMFPIDYEKTLIREHLENREQWYIDTLKPKYNIRKIAENNLGIKHSDETKRKLSEKNKGSLNGFYGKKHSKETKELFKNRENINSKYLLKASQERRKYTDDDILKFFDLYNSGFTKKNLEYLGLLTSTQYKNILWNKERYSKLKEDYNLKLSRNV